jgi:hypothetical protein
VAGEQNSLQDEESKRNSSLEKVYQERRSCATGAGSGQWVSFKLTHYRVPSYTLICFTPRPTEKWNNLLLEMSD